MSFFGFHPIIADWFGGRFAAPTEPQRLGWPAIAAGEHTLIAAPTGSGKTLTAFLSCIDRLLKDSLAGRLGQETRVVYVSPLRALSNDMHRNLEVPLREIRERVVAAGVPGGSPSSLLPSPSSLSVAVCEQQVRNGQPDAPTPIRAGLRTGDTSPSQRAALVRKPPHILVTTPESLYLLLTAEKGRQSLRNVDTVIVDEIHALVRDKRGSHLALSLERLAALTDRPLQRIGLSATQKPIERTAAFLVGSSFAGVAIVDVGHERTLDLAIETPASELGAVCMHEQWAEVHQRLVELINAHRSTLIFVNTRRLAERVTHELTELLGEDVVGAHHGSLSATIRLETERRLKSGELKAVVATASLELGLDIGYIDLVVQLGSPRAIATFLQRIGRSGHSLGLVPKGRLFALTRDELLECMALIRAVRSGRLDVVAIPDGPLDVLAQQIVAEVSARDCDVDELIALCRRADPYRNLSRRDFDRTVEYLSEGIARTGARGRRFLHYDRVGKRITGRKGARIVAVNNAGAIPEVASYRVVAEPDETVVGSLDEDFSVESNRGDVFLLGNTSWRILHVRGGDVTVVDAQGAPPTIPFWRGEAPGRTLELSEEVSRLRADLELQIAQQAGAAADETRLAAARRAVCDADESDVRQATIEHSTFNIQPSTFNDSQQAATDIGQRTTNVPADPHSVITAWLAAETHCTPFASAQAVEYVAAQHAAIGLVPTDKRVVFERFFDETGGMQLVVHAPFGAAINRAWALALRKRFCRSFDFELQATADDDGFILSIGPQHSFPLESLFGMVTRQNLRTVLEQAVLAAPVFQIRWRWNVTRALLVSRRENGKKVPPHLQRFRADDLLSAVFPRLTGCQEEHTGDIEIPDHPLVAQTMDDCLSEYLDLAGAERVLEQIEAGQIELVARDTREPSPFCYELLNAYPYAFLDGGEIQEQRARAVSTRRSLSVESVRDLAWLDPAAIEQVRREAQPEIRNADELHDVLLSRIVLPLKEQETRLLRELSAAGRATSVTLPDGRSAWVAAERLPAALAVFPDCRPDPDLPVPDGVRTDWESAEARVAMVAGLIEVCGPATADEVADTLSITASQAAAALEALEGEGVVLRGRFTERRNAEDGARNHEAGTAAIENGDGHDITHLSTHFTHPASPLTTHHSPTQWCHRRLLARIHRLTLAGLRREIEPVGVDVYVRFLARHQGLLPGHRRGGPNGVYEVIAMLQGLDLPAVCWERDVLPGRLEGYEPAWLDELCLTGEIGWSRLFPSKADPERSRPMASMTRVIPVSLFLRADAGWLGVNRPQPDLDVLSSPARQVLELLAARGAMFATDLLAETQMLAAHLDDVLGELVARGLITSDGFAGLRRLIAERSNGAARHRARRPGLLRKRMTSSVAGRWSLAWNDLQAGCETRNADGGTRKDERQAGETPGDGQSSIRHASVPHSALPTLRTDMIPVDDPIEHWAWQLLRRWGVVFRDLLTREQGAPRWFELCRVYRRLEARGEIRGGRFILGVGGEQFALPEAVRQLRRIRDESTSGELIEVVAADPLNLVGIITPDARVPATASNRVVFVDGLFVASRIGGEFRSEPAFDELSPGLQQLIFREPAGSAVPVRADVASPT